MKDEAVRREPSGESLGLRDSRRSAKWFIAFVSRLPISRTALAALAPNFHHTMHEDPIAFFITWTCYGTYLPGDERGWTKWHKGDQVPQPLLEDWCRDQMAESAVILDAAQREIVNQVVNEHCGIRGWTLHAVNCRSNHCHVVVTAIDYDGEQVRDQLKAWGTRRLKEHQRSQLNLDKNARKHWWTRKGSVRKLFDDASLEAAIQYTLDAQDIGGSKANYQ